MKAPRDERQMELFSDPKREWAALAIIGSLQLCADKIEYLHDLMQKVKMGVPGYARPERVKRMRAFRQNLMAVLLKSTLSYRPIETRSSLDRERPDTA